jgi:hypothetical protein
MNIDRLIDEAKKPVHIGAKCATCKNKAVASIVARYYERLDSGEELPSLWSIWSRLIEPAHGISFGSIKNHARRCLNRNYQTGKLNGTQEEQSEQRVRRVPRGT